MPLSFPGAGGQRLVPAGTCACDSQLRLGTCMEIRVNSSGRAGGTRLIILSPAPPLPCRFPRWQPMVLISVGTRALPIHHQMSFQAPAPLGGTGVTAWCLSKCSGQLGVRVGPKAVSLLWGQALCQSPLGKLGSAVATLGCSSARKERLQGQKSVATTRMSSLGVILGDCVLLVAAKPWLRCGEKPGASWEPVVNGAALVSFPCAAKPSRGSWQ